MAVPVLPKWGRYARFPLRTHAPARHTLSTGWEHYRGQLGSVWEVWRGDKASDNVPWEKVDLPHCFNARDAVDPDTPYYQGPGWYRTLLKVVAQKGGVTVTDEVTLRYQSTKWTKPAKMDLRELKREGGKVTVEAVLTGSNGVPCLDARNIVRFGLTGDGRLLDNLGTSSGSRKVELCNGRARIGLLLHGGSSVASVSAAGLPTAFPTVK